MVSVAARAARRTLALAALLAAVPLSAQSGPGTAGWHEVMRGEDGTTVSIDSASIRHTRDSVFVVETAVRFPQPMQLESGQPIDREVDVEELDCAAGRSRGFESRLHLDTALVRRVTLSAEWAPVAENRRPLFDARCGYLLSSFAAALPVGYELAGVEKQPELANGPAVVTALSRAFPPRLRAAGDSGLVVIRMRLREDGTVDTSSIHVVRTTHPGFSDAARRVAAVMRFRPARVGGKAVPVWLTLPVSFASRAGAAPAFVPLGSSGPDRRAWPAPEVVRPADPAPPPTGRAPPRP
jgi:TonB family protein